MSYFGPSSSPSDPVTTTANSPDNLPLTGYTTDNLIDYTLRQLGSPTWEIELTRQQIADCSNDALALFSKWCPNMRVGNVQLIRGQYKYLEDYDVDQGIVDIHFVEPNPVPTEIFFLVTLSTPLPSSDWVSTSTTSSFAGARPGRELRASNLIGSTTSTRSASTSTIRSNATRPPFSSTPVTRT
jgi:hypothetical protein